MTSLCISYLTESSICLLLFMGGYRLLISNLTHFTWMRFYIIFSFILSLTLPFITLPIQWSSKFQFTEPINDLFISPINQISSTTSGISISNTYVSNVNWLPLILKGILIAYLTGVLIKTILFIKNVSKIVSFIKINKKSKEGKYWIVNINEELPAFSFLNYIFININFKKLSEDDICVIKQHEKTHVDQFHSLDTLMIEFISIIFWFNPAVKYLKKAIQEVHEFIVDETIAGQGENRKVYAKLLLNLATESKALSLAISFSGEYIKRRISTLAKPRTSSRYKILILIIVPISTLLLLSFSYIKNPNSPAIKTIQSKDTKDCILKIGQISWKGNSAFNSKKLNEVLGLKAGDDYDREELNKKLLNEEIQTLYFDNGFAYYKAEVFEYNQNKNLIDITINVNEGVKCKIGEISVAGNKSVPSESILKKVEIKSGEYFNKTKIHNSLLAINSIGKFDIDKLNITPIPNAEKSSKNLAVLDLVFQVSEINK